MRLAELKEHLFTVPEHPTGFLIGLPITRKPGASVLVRISWRSSKPTKNTKSASTPHSSMVISLTANISRAEPRKNFSISSHICHPSLADDNLSGIAFSVALAQHLTDSAASLFLSLHLRSGKHRCHHLAGAQRRSALPGSPRLVLTCVGDSAPITYKRSRQATAEIDRAFAHILKHSANLLRWLILPLWL